MQVGEQGHTPIDHRAGSGDHDGAAAAGCYPMPLMTVVAFQPDAFILANVMAPDRQDSVVDGVVVRAVEPRPP